ncbi:MAG: HlyD family efflux transporter periplasmic adaptor subunit [Bacteroidota bacterium]
MMLSNSTWPVRFNTALLFSTLFLLLSSCGNTEAGTEKSETTTPVQPTAVTAPVPVQVMEVQNSTIRSQIPLTGRLQARRAVSVVAEVSGKVLPQRKELDVGVVFKKGEALLRIERTQTDLSLYAMRAKFASQLMGILADLEADFPDAHPKWKAYTDNFDHEQLLPPLPEFGSSREKYLFNLRNIPGQYLDIKAQEDRLDKYVISAPFTGVITQSSVDYGDVVSPGKPVAQLLGTQSLEFVSAVSEQQIAYLKAGSKITLRHSETGETYTASLVRTGGIIDENTQTIPVYLAVKGQGLTPGMYLEGELAGAALETVAVVPSHLITRNDEVYVVEDGVINRLPIQRVGTLDSGSIVRGIPDGSLVVSQTVSAATLRAKVKPVRKKSS